MKKFAVAAFVAAFLCAPVYAADIQPSINAVTEYGAQAAAEQKAADDVAYTALQAQFDAYKASHPDVPVPPVDPVPPTTGFPDASNTGPIAGTVLKPATGSITISKAGTYSGLQVLGSITVTAASGVIIENSKVIGGGINADNGRVITVRHTLIDGQGKFSGSACVQAFGFIETIDCRGHENGIVVQSGKNGWAKANYIHDLTSANAQGHFDGIAIQEAVTGFLIEGNAIWGRDTSDVFLKGDFGPIANVTVNANLLRIQPGQVSKTAFVVNVDGRQQKITGLKVTNNQLEKAAFGYMSFDTVSGVVETGNTDWKTGATVH